MNLVESLLNEYRPPEGEIGFHGTSIKFVPSILRHGFKADPELKNYNGDFESYQGTYFSDSFTVALYRGHVAAEKHGLPVVVFICRITEPVAGDEDAVIDFVEQEMWESVGNIHDDFDFSRYRTDAAYREAMSKHIDEVFQDKFTEPTPSEFYDLVLHHETGGSPFDAKSRQLIDVITRKIGPVTGTGGDHGSVSFRYPGDLGVDRIVAVVECHYDGEVGDHLPDDFSYKVIYGTMPSEMESQLV